MCFSFNMDLLQVPSNGIRQKRKKGRKTGVSGQVETTSHTGCKEQDLGKSTFNRKCAIFTVVMKVSDEYSNLLYR